MRLSKESAGLFTAVAISFSTTYGVSGNAPAPDGVLWSDDFDRVASQPSAWSLMSGENWVYRGGRFGEITDGVGANGLGFWASAGDAQWEDYTFTAEMCQELDGMGSVLLAVRFQDPANYYALEWYAASEDTISLVRCKDGHRYTIASSGPFEKELDEFPFTLSVAVAGDQLIGFLNGEPVVRGFAGDFSAGGIALGEIERRVLIDNARVEPYDGERKMSHFLRGCRLEYGLTPKYFLRNTGKMKVPFVLRNASDEPLTGIRTRIELAEAGDEKHAVLPFSDRRFFESIDTETPVLNPEESRVIEFTLDTRLLKPGVYEFLTQVVGDEEGMVRDEVFSFGIARNWNEERFDYFMWSLPANEADIAEYAAHGFTMGIENGRATPFDWENEGLPIPPDASGDPLGEKASKFSLFDLCLKHGFVTGSNLGTPFSPIDYPDDIYGLHRKDGKEVRSDMPVPYDPKFHAFNINYARTTTERLKDYPAFRLMNVNTETENHTRPDFSGRGRAFAMEDFGGPIPEGVEGPEGIPHTEVPGLASDGIVKDDHDLLRFYRWYFLRGEAYNTLAVEMKDAVLEIAPDLVVFHDPAERMPFIRDRHDGMNPWDWTYTVPNAMTVPYKTEIIRAMTEPGNDHIVNYVQVLWKGKVVSGTDMCPSAAMLRLGLLHSASRPVFAVGHWNAAWMTHREHADRWAAVKDLNDRFFQPVGPVLHNLKTQTPRRVAMLVSFTDQLFASEIRGKWMMFSAFSAWYEAFARANIEVDIIFEESVAEGGLKAYEALFIPFGELISRSAHDGLTAFAESGGRVVADRHLGYAVPGVTVLTNDMDHMVYPHWAWMRLKEGKGVDSTERIRRMWSASDEIEQVFAPFRDGVPTTDSRWLVITQREWEGIPYIYAVNDHRSAGSIGTSGGAILEQGEPLTADITLPRDMGPVKVYDLTEHKEVVTRPASDGSLTWTSDYAPASAKLFAVLPQALASMEVTVPAKVGRGANFDLAVRLVDEAGHAVRGLIPLRVTIRDGQGAVSGYGDYFAAKNGVFDLTGTIAMNDTGGSWSVAVEDLATGHTAVRYFKVPPRL